MCGLAALWRAVGVALLAAPALLCANAQATPLHEAVLRSDRSAVAQLLAQGANPNAMDAPGGTAPLHLAAGRFADRRIVTMLIEAGADVNLRANHVQGDTPLIYAAMFGRRDVISLLLDRGADVNRPDLGGFTPLHEAINQHHTELATVKLLVERGANVNATAATKASVINHAVSLSAADIVEYLLAKGADPNTIGYFGDTPLWTAVSKGDSQIVRLLLRHKPDLSVRPRITGRSLLQEAARDCRPEIARLLVAAGADVAERTPPKDGSPGMSIVDLAEARDCGREVVEQLRTLTPPSTR